MQFVSCQTGACWQSATSQSSGEKESSSVLLTMQEQVTL